MLNKDFLMNIDKLKNIIQSSHVNFLFGSGLSSPYLKTLTSIDPSSG